MDSFTSVQATWDSVKSTTEYRNFRPLGGHSVVGEAFRACLSRVRGEFLPSPHLENLTPSPENSSIAVLNSTPQRTLLRAPQSTETFDLWAVHRPWHLGPTSRAPHALLYSEDSPIAVLKSTPAPQNAKLPHERRDGAYPHRPTLLYFPLQGPHLSQYLPVQYYAQHSDASPSL